MIPRGATSSRCGRKGDHASFSSVITAENTHELAEYFGYIYFDCPDILTAKDISDLTGLDNKSISRFLKDGELNALEKRPKYLIAKTHLLEFVTNARFLNHKSNSEMFKKILGGFGLWKTAKL